jgi:adenine C2-methylase RlmN of 23S rRNA A2503 and tRNA A37
MIPNLKWMQQFTELVQEAGLGMKFHFSLHGTTDEARRRLMPLAAEIKPSLEAVATYRGKTGNPIEVHYSLNDENDDDRDIINLRELLLTYMIPIKFLAYKERPGAPPASERITRFQNALMRAGLSVEYYDPPGSDIGSSCGQFLLHRDKSEK